MKTSMGKYIYTILVIIVLLPISKISNYSELISPAISLLLGLLFAIIFKNPYPRFNKKTSKYLLQVAIVGYGFTMNLHESLKSGADGMTFTLISVIGVMLIGVALGYWLHVDRKTAYLLASGTAICGGSAIAAVGPVIKANDNEMAVSLGVIFLLNALALFIFPPLGHIMNMSETQFGTWAAIAIHDTSSVVGASDSYGDVALQTATLVKLTRALWIIPLAVVTMFAFKDNSSKISIPWFIFIFIAAILINTYIPLPAILTSNVAYWAKKGMALTLFMIGASLSIKNIKSVGIKPLVLAVLLWILIGLSSLIVVINTIS